jgi:hypothetical protein
VAKPFTAEQREIHKRRIADAIAARPAGIETRELLGLIPVSKPLLREYLASLETLGRIRSTIRRHSQSRPPFGAYDARVYFPADSIDASAGPEPKRRDARRRESEVGP